ncbi:HNH endonuclease [Leptospira kemamanensis]|uniref:HNH endonuclease n=1 Tax=Leptospira kemamanensis TaxID=2484942 RepID=A0A4R9JRZ0_9LEPT|nr:HNH endonuclease [Leptospira kemamanensis]TGL51542.1 HNH endonuclease [Leptospira kemamanensis]
MSTAKFQNKTIEENFGEGLDKIPLGKEKEVIIKSRINQSFFRSAVLSSYDLKCCITGLSVPELLVASHIVPWSRDETNRLNPRNGLCLNSLHDNAFDKGFITITPDFKIKTSNYLKDYLNDKAYLDMFKRYENQTINLPDKFLPSKEFLDFHFNQIFRK